jgi:hypothetical protein
VAGAVTPRFHQPLTRGATPAVLARELADALIAVDARYTRAHNSLTAEQRDRSRADGGWSAHQIIEHVVRTNEAYLPRLDRLAGDMMAAPRAPSPWRGKLFAQWLATSLTKDLRMRAPKSIEPGPSPRVDVLKAMIATHQQVRVLMERCSGTDWNAGFMRSPFAALLRLNFGDACVVMLRHSERHAHQLERLVASFADGRA